MPPFGEFVSRCVSAIVPGFNQATTTRAAALVSEQTLGAGQILGKDAYKKMGGISPRLGAALATLPQDANEAIGKLARLTRQSQTPADLEGVASAADRRVGTTDDYIERTDFQRVADEARMRLVATIAENGVTPRSVAPMLAAADKAYEATCARAMFNSIVDHTSDPAVLNQVIGQAKTKQLRASDLMDGLYFGAAVLHAQQRLAAIVKG